MSDVTASLDLHIRARDRHRSNSLRAFFSSRPLPLSYDHLHHLQHGSPLTKVVYQPEREATNEYVILVNPDEYRKWKEGGTHFSVRLFECTIPLVDVVDSFQVLWSNQGNQGKLSTPSRQQLENDFGTHVDTDVVQQILEKGREQTGKAVSSGTATTNQSKGSFAIDTRGKSGIQAGSGSGR
ncbi:ribosome maturation protein [Fomitopsis serialis]|uniref:ribosome maturation protein n=1 Tax=Fomitopsis serialis TaxID=139415 RepID=UPI0020072F8D|nr:ribosome maturation protein [Neoantrodia serialis]KAH9927217.1 ribosome maturation protein [Neoantrodia serialis]